MQTSSTTYLKGSSTCPCLHAQEHVTINMLDNQKLVLVLWITGQNSSSDEGLEGYKNRIFSGNSFDPSEPQILVDPARATRNASGVWLNKCELEGANIRNFAFEHKYNLNKDSPLCSKLYECAIEARRPMERRIGSEVICRLSPVDGTFIIELEVAIFTNLNNMPVSVK